MISPTVGIMMPVYNGYKTVLKSIDSLISQSFKNWICVIVNDGSTDETDSILRGISDERFYTINLKKNLGRGAARKKALEKLIEFNVQYICFLDADDMYMPDKLEWQVKMMNSNKKISLLSSSIGIINDCEELIRVLELPYNTDPIIFSNHLGYKPIPFASSIIRTIDLNTTTFDDQMRVAEDQDFLQRLLLSKYYMFVPKLSYLYYRDFSFSLKKYKESLKSEYYTIRKFEINKFIILKKLLTIHIKIYIITLLYLLKLQHLYLSNFGRKPETSEITLYKKYLNEFR